LNFLIRFDSDVSPVEADAYLHPAPRTYPSAPTAEYGIAEPTQDEEQFTLFEHITR
jgi:hypothetical protein